MDYWGTFVKVWQVRASIKIQESLEESYRGAKENAETQANIPKIIEELNYKNESWEKQINHHRNKNKKYYEWNSLL